MVRTSSFYHRHDDIFLSPGSYNSETDKSIGPVVRITPDEVSLSDPENYSKIYHMGSKYWKSPNYYRVFGAPAAFFTTVPAEAMLGRVQVGWIVGAGLLALGLLIVTRFFWSFALRFYTSASS